LTNYYLPSSTKENTVTQSPSNEAWNKFVMNSQPGEYPKGSIKNAAAIANRYMGGANGGGLNSFLTNSWELDAGEVCESLEKVGALFAAQELRRVLDWACQYPCHRKMTDGTCWNNTGRMS
jgi:hypothetical protein